MAQDIFFGKSKRNWSREPAASNPEFAVQAKAERKSAALAKLTDLKAKSDSGDKKAQKKWAKINKKVAKLHLKASKGDLKAAKQLAALTPTGLFVTTVGPTVLKTAMHGSFVGKDEILGTFVGKGTVTKIRGNDKLTEIVTSGGAFVGNDKLTEIITSGAFVGDNLAMNIAMAPTYAALDAGSGMLLAWPIIALIDFFSDRSARKAANARNRSEAAKAVDAAIAKGLTSGREFTNATYLTFGWNAEHGTDPHGKFVKYNQQVDNGVPEVRASVVKKVRAGDPKAIAFYKAVLNSGYTPSKKDPGLAQLSGAFVGALATEILGNDALTEIVTSGAFVGEEERTLAAEGGACERAALKRRRQRFAPSASSLNPHRRS